MCESAHVGELVKLFPLPLLAEWARAYQKVPRIHCSEGLAIALSNFTSVARQLNSLF
jgi:hypothetical protein